MKHRLKKSLVSKYYGGLSACCYALRSEPIRYIPCLQVIGRTCKECDGQRVCRFVILIEQRPTLFLKIIEQPLLNGSDIVEADENVFE